MTILAGISHRCICNRLLFLVIRHLHHRQHQSIQRRDRIRREFLFHQQKRDAGEDADHRRDRIQRREAEDSAGVEKVVDAGEDADHRRCKKHTWTHVLDGGSGQKGHMRTILKSSWVNGTQKKV